MVPAAGLVRHPDGVTRCWWPGSDPLYLRYHDDEWGRPVTDDSRLFEKICLEGFQAGLSWLTILRKREAYREAFSRFDPRAVSRYDGRAVRRLLRNPGIVRNRLKIESAIANARAFLDVQDEFGSFDAYVWRFVEGRPKRNAWRSERQIPAVTPEAEALSRDLRARGFRFVGPTICYAHMQATGMVNDHVVGCFRHADVNRLGRGS
jgi:DNA-3-methyladenine glycosylase I